MSALNDPTATRDAAPAEGEGRAGPPRVVFIAGTGRSGSTLLERLLGQSPEMCALGEVVHLWQRGVLENQKCGCGRPFEDCPFWSRVGAEAFGGWGEMGSSIRDLKGRVDRHRYIPLMLIPRLSRRYAADLAWFSEVLVRLYRSVLAVSGSRIIVDSSKSSSYAILLRTIRDVDLRLVHLVRDSRGVAYSATKRVERPEVVSGRAYMPTYHPARSALEWDAYNSLFELVGASGTPSLRVRYEDLLEKPKQELTRVLEFAGFQAESNSLDFVKDGVASLRMTHTISGNPMRFESGDVRLRLDDEWTTRLALGHRRTVTLLTWPWMKRYGYDIRTRSRI